MDRSIHWGYGQRTGIGRKSHVVDLMLEGNAKDLLSGLGIPKAHGIVGGTRGETPPIGVKVQTVDGLAGAGHRLAQFASRYTPQADHTIVAGGGDVFAICDHEFRFVVE